MKKVSTKEFTEIVQKLDKPGESIPFVLDFEQDAESTNPDDYYGWWCASRVRDGSEVYTILHQCGGVTFDTIIFDSPNAIDEDDIRGFLGRHTDFPDSVMVEMPLPAPEKKDILSIAEQVEPEVHRLLDEYYDTGEVDLCLYDNDILNMERDSNGRIWIERAGIENMTELWDNDDATIIAAYEALLALICGKLEKLRSRKYERQARTSR